MTKELCEYITEVHEAKLKMGCVPRYERPYRKSDASEAWMAGWYRGLLDEALRLIPDAVLHGWMDEAEQRAGKK